MKTISSSKIAAALAVAGLLALLGHSVLQSAPDPSPVSPPPGPAAAPAPVAPPAPAQSALPPGILPASPLAQVIRLAQAGLDPGILMAYVTNSTSTFNLNSDKIIYATDAGVPNDVLTAMMQRDQQLQQVATPAPAPQSAPATAPPPAATPDTSWDIASEPQTVNVNYFYDTLTPYGTWINIAGYGNCWRPNVAVYDAGWAPYCDRGYWAYTDCGWYWYSDYSWGCTFHYGRWFRDAHWGWCWWPDTVWGPSWVTWRYSDSYCGWAPLPPYAVWQPGIGFLYHGNGVSVGFDFGLDPNCYVFVPSGNFCDVRLRVCRVPMNQVTVVYNRTTVINNININANRTIINAGIGAQLIAAATHRQIQAQAIRDVRNDYYQHVNATRRTLRTTENERRADMESNAGRRIDNAENRLQQQRDRVSAAEQQYNSTLSQRAIADRQQDIDRRQAAQDTWQNYNAQQNATRQDAVNRAQAAADAQRQAANAQRDQIRNEVRQEQSRQSQAAAEAQSRAQQQAQSQQQSQGNSRGGGGGGGGGQNSGDKGSGGGGGGGGHGANQNGR
ncbi:MAG TPA: DUF6600 domain-containing protein [Verrucomicrobiae bacterium]|nr:DUF6600 domain-containing protein [Verrucomicrobiae bacterium]